VDKNHLLESIRLGDNKVLEHLYKEYRIVFTSWFTKYYNLSSDDAIEIYQNSFTIFYFNVRNGKIKELNSSLKTYLFAIGKNLVKEKYRSDIKYSKIEFDAEELLLENSSFTVGNILDEYLKSDQIKMVRNLLEKIGDPCKKLLTLIFIKNFSFDSVVKVMNYSDERVARKRKSVCLQKMRDLVNDNKEIDFY
jgi:RNA polymerase sigma factor (sigma-70 family)